VGPSIQSLRVFLSILEHGSLSATGRELGMTQPAVSNHLHALEERFGVALLVRGGHVRPTPAGVALAKHARQVLEDLAALEEEMTRHAGPRGRLVVGTSSTPAELLLPRLAASFSAQYPEVALDVRVADTQQTLATLLEGEVEVAVVGRAAEHPKLVGVTIEEDELVPVVSADDRLADRPEETPVSAEDLSGRAFVLREEGSATRRAAEEGLRSVGVRPRVAMELGSNAAVAGAVAAGAGVGIVPKRTVASQPAVRTLNVGGLSVRRPFVLVVERGRTLSPAAEAFAALCKGKE
jgi:DNA-binding transcriptional LysR family regulator